MASKSAFTTCGLARPGSGACRTPKGRIAQKTVYQGSSKLAADAKEWPKWLGPFGDGIRENAAAAQTVHILPETKDAMGVVSERIGFDHQTRDRARVRLRHAEGAYWPNLGYGRFCAKVNLSDGVGVPVSATAVPGDAASADEIWRTTFHEPSSMRWSAIM